MKITDDDKNIIKNDFPDLKFETEGSNLFLRGRLFFVTHYNNNKYITYDLYEDNGDKYLIQDNYEIEINLSVQNPYREVINTDNRLINVAKNKKIKPEDIHVYDDSKLCIAGYLEENLNISFLDFFSTVVIPFFYDQSFYEKYNEWPRGEYSHGSKGILENYFDIYNLNDGFLKIKSIKAIDVMSKFNNDKEWKKIKGQLLLSKITLHLSCLSKIGQRGHRCKCDIGNFRGYTAKAVRGMILLHEHIYKYNLRHLIK